MRVFCRQRVLLRFLWASLGLANACAPLFFWVGGQHQSNGTQSPGGSSEEVAAIAADLLINDQTTYSGAYNTEIFTEGPADATARTLRFTVPIDSLSVYSNASLRCAPSETDLLNSNSMATLSEDIQNVIGVHQVAASDGVATAAGGQATLTLSQTFTSSAALTFACRLETSTTPSLSSKAVTITLNRTQSQLIGMRDYSAADFALPDGDTAEESGAANYSGRAMSLSEDGRYTAFASQAKNLTSGISYADAGTHYYSDVFLFDRAKGTTELISKCTGKAAASRQSGAPQISGDGNFVVFETYAKCLTDPAANESSDFYVPRQIALWDRLTKAITILSVEYHSDPALPGTQSSAYYPAISFNGDRVVFITDGWKMHTMSAGPGRNRIILSELDTNSSSPTYNHYVNRGDLMKFAAANHGPDRYEFFCGHAACTTGESTTDSGISVSPIQISGDGDKVYFLSKYRAQAMTSDLDYYPSSNIAGDSAWPDPAVNQLYMFDVANNTATVLSAKPADATADPPILAEYTAADVLEFSVSTSADTIAYTSTDAPFKTPGAVWNIFIASLTAAPTQLDSGDYARKPTVSADGKTIVVEYDSSNQLVYYQKNDLDGTWGPRIPLSISPATAGDSFRSLTLSGDGSYLSFAAKDFSETGWAGTEGSRSLWDALVYKLK